MRELVLKVDPVNQMPYIAYVQSGETTDDYKAGVLSLDYNALVSLGGLASEGRAANVSLAFDAAGSPFISFADYTNEVSQSASVMNYASDAWGYVGGTAGKGITDVRITYNGLVLKEDGTPFLFAMNNSAGALLRRELNISEYNGSAWTTSVAMPG